jgi:formimidoylglutamate deiminase
VETSSREPQRGFGLYFQRALLAQGWANDVRLTVDGGVIAQVECGVQPRAGDTRAVCGLPGMPNVHSHAFQRGMAGLTEHRGTDHDTFWTWRELMYRFLAHMTPDDVEAITAQAYVEMLEAGFTRVGEFHYLHHDPQGQPYADPAEMTARVVAAAQRTGIALTLLPVFYAHGGFGGMPPTAGQRRFLCDLERYVKLLEASRSLVARLPHGRSGLAPHSLRAVTPEELSILLPLAGADPVHLHIAEQVREVEACEAWCGKRPVQWLFDQIAVDARFCLVHATHVNAEETERIAKSGAVVGLCPITEANLGDGYFPAVQFLKHAGSFAIGTDSNIAIRVHEELRMLEYGQRLQHRARNLFGEAERSTGRVLFDGALRGGARALGAPAGLDLGAPADLISLEVSGPAFVGREGDRALDTWIFSADTGAIDRVWRAGVEVVTNGRHRERDAIAARYRRTLEALLQA